MILKLEPCRGASDYAKPPSVLLKRVRMDGYSERRAGSLIPKFRPHGPAFHSSAGLARSLAIRVNRRSTFPAPSYSCYRPGYGYLTGYSMKGESLPLWKPPQMLIPQETSATTVSPRFAARIPDATLWFTGALQGHSLLVEPLDQIVRCRKGCWPFRLHVRVRCQPTSL